ncbi:hypothetical protein K469DRAFT_713718 [Zopfia rhizophila CBS 207.26]|uniref:Uncharacterized protein n=1 Tax=Zopfia rhizophila CBS 207.26 TaxID=1314779 RepID=A0A6A6DP34_9PEZI|nr:hypothetical protein K469DRAFT_713718 [Zopfia rhizophila CBS 207.26]
MENSTSNGGSFVPQGLGETVADFPTSTPHFDMGLAVDDWYDFVLQGLGETVADFPTSTPLFDMGLVLDDRYEFGLQF